MRPKKFVAVFIRATVGALVLISASATSSHAQSAIARAIPGEDLAFCAEFQGLEEHAAAWRNLALYRVLNRTTTGAMLESLVTQLCDKIRAESEGRTLKGEDAIRLAKHVARYGFGFAIIGKASASESQRWLLVIRGGAQADVNAPLEQFVRYCIAPEGAPTQVVTRQDGRKAVIIRSDEERSWAFWSEKEDFIVASAPSDDGYELFFETLDGKRPNAVTHPSRGELSKADGDFVPVAWAFADPALIAHAPAELDLAAVKRIDCRWGFQENALVSITRVIAPAPRRGLATVFDQPVLDGRNLPPVPVGLNDLTIASVDLGVLHDRLTGALPNGDVLVRRFSETFWQKSGIKLREDLLTRLGPRLAFYIAPEKIDTPLTPIGGFTAWLFHLPKFTALIEVKDSQAFGGTLETLVAAANRELKDLARGGPALELRRLEGNVGYELWIPPERLPLPAGYRPTLLVGKEFAAIATSTDAARRALNPEGDKPATAAARALPANAIFLNASDPRGSMPDWVANLPFLIQLLGAASRGAPPMRNLGFLSEIRVDATQVPLPDEIRTQLFPATTTASVDSTGLTITSRAAVPSMTGANAAPLAVALLLPAIRSARAAAYRSQSVNNMKQIGLAMHNYHAVHNTFPAAAICDDDGKPLLSWRVAILPFIEGGDALYGEFHLDEPWDSPHNKTLLDKMPAVFRPVKVTTKDPFLTFYQVFVGNGALFETSEAAAINTITDGTSNTIMAVEGGKPVPWTKPDDLPYDPEKPFPRLGGMKFPGGFNVLFGDGSVRFLKNSINVDVLRALISKAGGEVIDADAF
jgi:prepilin-type processing-associated H-X9-DG protein